MGRYWSGAARELPVLIYARAVGRVSAVAVWLVCPVSLVGCDPPQIEQLSADSHCIDWLFDVSEDEKISFIEEHTEETGNPVTDREAQRIRTAVDGACRYLEGRRQAEEERTGNDVDETVTVGELVEKTNRPPFAAPYP